MLRNTVAATLTYFYPFGNTPAICLTQHLPPELPANLLLLGCGDVRNILFTTYTRLGNQQLDFTCCDIEPAIIARNVLLLSLIVDDVNDEKSALLWNIYYHVRVDSASIELLDSQAIRLLSFSASLASWNGGPYGQVVRFCDCSTLAEVRKTWRGYTTQGLSPEQLATRHDKLEDTLRRAKDVRKVFLGDSAQLTGGRAAAPTSMQALGDLSILAKEYWNDGCLYTGQALPAASQLNPAMLFSGTHEPTLHYGSDPLLGFHLATAYVPFKKSPLPRLTASTTKRKLLEAAQVELRTWSKAFRQAYESQNVVVRYFSGDALAFAHTIQHVNHAKLTSAGWYNNQWSYRPLELDSEEYGGSRRSAPTSFNVIDTSNLGDHLGTLNMLIAALPLLRRDPSSTVYTEILVQHEKNVKSTLDKILCGDLDTVSLLMGVVVPESWTNATTSIETDQLLLDVTSQLSGNGKKGQQARTHIPWKLSNASSLPSINMKAAELSKILHAVYQNMFEHENPMDLFSSISLSGIDKVSNPFYNRASFVALLQLVKTHVVTDWPSTIETLMMNIENDNALSVSRNYLQELNGCLHLAGLNTSHVLLQNPAQVFGNPLTGDLARWKTLPAMVVVTVEVPRNKIDFFTKMEIGKTGIPSFCCSLQSSGIASSQWMNHFGVVQSGFGHVKIDKTNVAGDHGVHIVEDEKGWAGTSPLVVSFYVSTWILLQEEDSTLIAVGFQATAFTAMTYVKTLGPNLQFFNTCVGDQRVSVSRTLPHQQQHWKLPSTTIEDGPKRLLPTNIGQETLTANVDGSGLRINSLVYKIEFQKEAKDTLADKATTVRTGQASPLQIELRMNDKVVCIRDFPRPVSASRSKLRIARKSSYVEIIAPLLNPLGEDKIDTFVYPMTSSVPTSGGQRYPIGSNFHTIKLDTCPTIDDSQPDKLEWITFHVTTMFSDRERAQREGRVSLPSTLDTRVDFKDGLFSIFMHSTGVQGHKARVFGLHKQATGIDTMIFVSSAKLDLNDRVVVLDAAVIPLKHSMMKDPLVGGVLGEMQSKSPTTIVKVDDNELKIWKSVLPALAERCRTWQHDQKSCEYIKHGQIPVPGGLEDASTPLCSCGVGRLPKNFMQGSIANVSKLDQMLQKYATRIAITPVFHVSYVEASLDVSRYGAPDSETQTTASGPVRSAGDVKDGDSCAVCGKIEVGNSSSTTSGGLLKCGRCKAVKYCSKDCQKKHWKIHKLVCS